MSGRIAEELQVESSVSKQRNERYRQVGGRFDR